MTLQMVLLGESMITSLKESWMVGWQRIIVLVVHAIPGVATDLTYLRQFHSRAGFVRQLFLSAFLNPSIPDVYFPRRGKPLLVAHTIGKLGAFTDHHGQPLHSPGYNSTALYFVLPATNLTQNLVNADHLLLL